MLRLFLQFVTEFCAEWCGSRPLQGQRASWGSWSVRTANCSLSEAQGGCGFGQGDSLSAQCCKEFRGASAWWCGTGEDSGLQRGRPDEAMAQSDFARFLAVGLAPAQWPPGSDEVKPNIKKTNKFKI